MSRAALIAVLVVGLGVGVALALTRAELPDLTTYKLLEERDVLVTDVGGGSVLIHLSLLVGVDGREIVAMYYDGVLIALDLAPDDPNVQALFDSGFCPVGKRFPVKPKPTGVFVPENQCPKVKGA
jgi:hypothetical protein